LKPQTCFAKSSWSKLGQQMFHLAIVCRVCSSVEVLKNVEDIPSQLSDSIGISCPSIFSFQSKEHEGHVGGKVEAMTRRQEPWTKRFGPQPCSPPVLAAHGAPLAQVEARI
jgi:hypothetical protein